MDLYQVKTTDIKRKGKIRVGRGSGSGLGKTSGRGHKGTGQRAGSGGKLLFEGGNVPLYRKLPKRGFSNALFKKEYQTLNVSALERFDNGAAVTPDLLVESGLIRKANKDNIKILGNGELTKKLTVTASCFSKGAIEKIEKAGGKTVVPE